MAGTQLIEAKGTRVTVEGIASNDVPGATVVVIGDVVYLPHLDRWDEALRGRTVRVEGRLTSPPPRSPCPYQGEVTCALWGKHWFLDDATWTIVGVQP